MTVSLQHLRAFLAIAREGGVSRAARRLNLAQPTLSQQLKAIEARYGAALFEDRKPPLRLTPLGRELLALTERLFEDASAIEDLLEGGGPGRLGHLRLGSDSPVYAARMAARLRARHPDLAIAVRMGNARETLHRLDDGGVDAAIVCDPPEDPHRVTAHLFADRLVAALPVDNPYTEGSFPLAALVRERLLVREAGSSTRAAVDRLLDQAKIRPADVIELQSREAIREGVALGLGVSILLASECPPDPRLARADLVCPEGVDPPRFEGRVVCRAERARMRLLRAVFDAAAAIAEDERAHVPGAEAGRAMP